MRTAQLPGKRIIRGTQPLQPILRMRIMAQNRATLPFCQATPHAVVGLGLQGIRQTLDTNLALVAAQANLTLRCTLHEERVRLSRRAQCARDPTLVVAVG